MAKNFRLGTVFEDQEKASNPDHKAHNQHRGHLPRSDQVAENRHHKLGLVKATGKLVSESQAKVS